MSVLDNRIKAVDAVLRSFSIQSLSDTTEPLALGNTAGTAEAMSEDSKAATETES